MPELPEVETTVRGLAASLDGARIERVTLNRRDMRRAFPDDLVQRLTGARVTGLGRRAKYGLVHTDRGATLIFHLGMSGRWRVDPAEPDKHDHLVIEWKEQGGPSVEVPDKRGFGSRLLDTVVVGELGGQLDLQYEPTGLFARLSIPPVGYIAQELTLG